MAAPRDMLAAAGKAAGVSLAALALAAQAAGAVTIKMGGDTGALVFEPSSVTIKAGDSVTWTNNAGFPHNVVFDEDEIPVRCLACSCSRPRSGVRLQRAHSRRLTGRTGLLSSAQWLLALRRCVCTVP